MSILRGTLASIDADERFQAESVCGRETLFATFGAQSIIFAMDTGRAACVVDSYAAVV